MRNGFLHTLISCLCFGHFFFSSPLDFENELFANTQWPREVTKGSDQCKEAWDRHWIYSRSWRSETCPTFNTCSLRMSSAIRSPPCTHRDTLPLCDRYIHTCFRMLCFSFRAAEADSFFLSLLSVGNILYLWTLHLLSSLLPPPPQNSLNVMILQDNSWPVRRKPLDR